MGLVVGRRGCLREWLLLLLAWLLVGLLGLECGSNRGHPDARDRRPTHDAAANGGEAGQIADLGHHADPVHVSKVQIRRLLLVRRSGITSAIELVHAIESREHARLINDHGPD
jgi:hypothetical protein